MSNFAVGIELTLKNNVSSALSVLAREMSAFDKVVINTTTNVEKLAAAMKLITGSNRSLSRMTSSLEKIGTSVTGITNGFDKAGNSVSKMLSQAERLSATFRDLAKQSGEVSRNTARGERAAERAGTRATPAARMGSSHDAYFAGMAVAGAGSAVVGFDLKSIHESMKVDSQAAILGLNNGWSPETIAAARKRAQEVSRLVPGTTIESNLENIREGYGQLGDAHESIENLLPMAKMSRFFAMMDRQHGGDGSNKTAVLNAYRFIEDTGLGKDKQTGHITPERMAEAANLIQRIYAGTQGRVGPNELFGFIKQARGAGVSLSEEGLKHYAPVMGALGASRSGTALSSSFQQFEIGKMTRETFREAQQAGIYDARAKWKGGRVIDASKHLTERELGSTDIMAWLDKVITPGLKKLGMLTTGADGAIAAGSLAGRTTTWGLLVEGLVAKAQIDKQYANINSTNKDPYEYLRQRDPFVATDELHSAQNELMVTLGGFLQGPFITLMRDFSSVLRSLTDWANENPDLAKKITETVTVFGLLSAALGTLYTAMLPFKFLLGAAPAAAVAGPPVAEAGGGWLSSLFKGAAGGLGLSFLFDHADDVKKQMENNPAARARNLREHGSVENVPGSHPLLDGLQAAINKLASIPLPPPVQQTVTVNAQVDLEGQKVGEIILNQIVRRADRPGNNQFDPRIGRLDPGSPF